MKKLLFVVILLASPVLAQGAVISVGASSKSTTTAEDNAVLALVQAKNADACTAIGLAATCTQAQYSASPLARPGITIYPNTGAGAQQYMLDRIFADIDSIIPVQQQQISNQAAAAAWQVASSAQQQAACTALGKDATTCK